MDEKTEAQEKQSEKYGYAVTWDNNGDTVPNGHRAVGCNHEAAKILDALFKEYPNATNIMITKMPSIQFRGYVAELKLRKNPAFKFLDDMLGIIFR